ncbi:hypothetical protein AVO46_18045 [Vibrio cholerae]|nr:hypothetical protein AVO46_18045 [Vibrio cholerae]
MLPHTDDRVGDRPVRNLHILVALRFQNPHPADVARIPSDDELAHALTPGDPGLQEVREVVDMVDDEAGASQGTAEDGEKIHQEGRLVWREGWLAGSGDPAAHCPAGVCPKVLCMVPW